MSEGIEQQVERLDHKVDELRSGVVRAGGAEDVLPPIGIVADFLGADPSPELHDRSRRDHLPIPDAANREGYRPSDDLGYWLTGLEDYDKVLRAAAELSVPGNRVYDFGGSTGRVFRHFYCQDRRFDVWTSDFKLPSYLWNQRYMPGDLRVFMNGFAPPLPLPDRHFHIVTAFSVLTHIDELESAWLVELRRILKPSGLLYVTVHDEAFWETSRRPFSSPFRRAPAARSSLRHRRSRGLGPRFIGLPAPTTAATSSTVGTTYAGIGGGSSRSSTSNPSMRPSSRW